MWALSRRKHVFAADWTVVFVLVFEAIVCLKYVDANAHAALVAVPKVFHSTNATKTTLLAVKGLFALSHPQIADTAMVLSKRNSTVRT